MTDHTDLIQCLRHAHEQRLISDLREHGDSADRKFVCRIVASARVAADALEAQAVQIAKLGADAARYEWLRARDLDCISQGGVFAGMTPDNVILNGEDLDRAIDERMNRPAPQEGE